MPLIRAGEVNMFYRLSGPARGEPVLFISGLGADWTNWEFQLPQFEDRYLCLVFDNRDAGNTESSPNKEYSIRDMARDAVELTYALGLDYTHVVSHSMGGAIAQEIAISYPERVASLTLIATFYKLETLGIEILKQVGPINTLAQNGFLSELVAPFTFNIKSLNDQAFIRFLEGRPNNFAAPTEGYKRQLRAIMNHDTGLDRLSLVRAPTLAVAGENDLVTPAAGMQRIAQAIPGSQFMVFPGTGHAPHAERATDFNYLLAEHLRAHPLFPAPSTTR